MSLPIADFHCDLLSYLEGGSNRTAYDPIARCSIDQLKKGRVVAQTLAIFTETKPKSTLSGLNQVKIFLNLPQKYPNTFKIIHHPSDIQIPENLILIMPSIENGSAFFEEKESFEDGEKRFLSFLKKVRKFVYFSLTWNQENRFGGGAHTQIGLKEDGKRLIDLLNAHQIPIDFSHASDYLAYDVINYLEQKNMKLPVLASHSNYRSVSNVPRNLSDEIAKEILKRKGIIGLNFFREFIGANHPSNFAKQLSHSLSLGAESQICFGADFFYAEDLPSIYHKPKEKQYFPGYEDASSYGKVIDLWKKELFLPQATLDKITHQNLFNFLKQKVYTTTTSASFGPSFYA